MEFLLVFFLSLISLSVGSFLNVLIYRLPIMMKKEWRQECLDFLELEQDQLPGAISKFNLLTPRSQCPNCHHAIRFWENIPVFSRF